MNLDINMLSGLNKKSQTLNSFCLLFEDINEETAKQSVQFIIESNFADKEERPDIINMIINSSGGSLSDAFAIIDVMRSSHIPIRTIGLGTVASAALMIFMAGTKGHRILTPNTSIMSHRYSAGSHGKAKSYLQHRKNLI